jgi:hypothetical protein
MKSLTGLLFILLLTPRVIAAQSSSTSSRDKEALITIEHRWLNAIEQRDVDFLNFLLDEDFVDTTVDGHQRSKHDVLTAPAVRDYDTQTLQDLVVRLHGNVGIVNGDNVVVGKHHSYVVTVHFTDVFQRSGGQWKAIAAHESIAPVR